MPYTFSSTPSTGSILDRTPSASPNTVWRERRAFAYYSEHAASFIAGDLDVGFWREVVPQVCRREPAVWDAVNAISALFESPDPCFDPVFLRRDPGMFRSLDQNYQDALVWYSRSLSNIRGQIDRRTVDTQAALVSCVLFICIETLQGHVEAALELYRQGECLILDLLNRDVGVGLSVADTTFLKEIVIPLFIRLGTVALTISGVPPSRLAEADNIIPDSHFSSLNSARLVIASLASEGMLFQRASEEHVSAVGGQIHIADELIVQQRSLLTRLDNWHNAFEQFVNLAPTPPNSATAILRTYYSSTKIAVSVCLTPNEAIYDAHIADFQTIVTQANWALDASAGLNGAQPPFRFEMGVGVPLFLTAMKCRHRSTRTRALQLLRKSPPVQGFYKCTPAAALAQKISEIEEHLSVSMHEAPQLNTQRLNPALTYTASPTSCSVPTHLETPQTPPYSPEFVSTATVIPDKARIRLMGIFRPQDTPWHVGDHDLSKWKRGPDQLFMKFIRNQYNSISGMWELIDDIVPIDY